MNEASWSACDDPKAMLGFLKDRASDRKKRLFAAACCRRIWHLVRDERSRRGVELLERYADGLLGADELGRAAQLAQDAAKERLNFGADDTISAEAVANALYEDSARPYDEDVRHEEDEIAKEAAGYTGSLYNAVGAAHAAAWAVGDAADPTGDYIEIWHAADKAEEAQQSGLIRDIFGNPFRPVKLDLASLAPAAVPLAQTIYDERAFDRLSELADSLEMAGCDNADIVAHCRGPGPHVRGCWVVDLMLRKS